MDARHLVQVRQEARLSLVYLPHPTPAPVMVTATRRYIRRVGWVRGRDGGGGADVSNTEHWCGPLQLPPCPSLSTSAPHCGVCVNLGSKQGLLVVSPTVLPPRYCTHSPPYHPPHALVSLLLFVVARLSCLFAVQMNVSFFSRVRLR